MSSPWPDQHRRPQPHHARPRTRVDVERLYPQLYRAPSRALVWGLRAIALALVLLWIGIVLLDRFVDDPPPTTAWTAPLRALSLLIMLVGLGWARRNIARGRPDPKIQQELRRDSHDTQRTEAARALRRGDALTAEQRPLAAAYVAGNSSLDYMAGGYLAVAGAGTALLAEGTTVTLLVMVGLWWAMALGTLAGSLWIVRLRSRARAQHLPVATPRSDAPPLQ